MIRSPFLFLLVLMLSISMKLSAQQPYTVKGVLVDPMSNVFLENGVISILNAKDSTLVNFARAKKDGTFSFSDLQKGKYLLTAFYPKYTEFVEEIQLDSANSVFDFGSVNMLLVSNLLKDVVITGRNAIVIKGDTIEYDASKFTIQPNSKVEDLLAQLPGIQVDKDGKITAQGETVTKVLVDGEEFFGDDPTLVTKNIRGDMVDKVQLYDKKSDQADFTGIDDGVKTKTINIQLKEDSKKGMFGKAEAGAATDDLYQGQLMFNKFKGQQKFAAYGTIANTGKMGLSWEDSDKYGSSSNIEMMDGGGIMIFGGGGDDLDRAQYNGQGIPLAHTGGLHYDSKWNDKNESINANYKIGSLEVYGNRNTLTEETKNDGINTTSSDQNYNNFSFRQKLDAKYEIKFDTSSTLKVTVDGTLRNSRNNDTFGSGTSDQNGQQLNNNTRNNSSEADGKIFNSSLLWNKRLKKKGRTVSIGLNQSVNKNNSEGLLNSNTNYYNVQTGILDSTNSIDQQKLNNTENLSLSSNIAYTEPITKFLTLAFNYRFNLNNGTSNLLSYNKSASGEYDEIDPTYTNKFDLNQFTNQAGTTLNYNKDKNIVSVGFSAADVSYKQIDNFNDNVIKRSFVNLNPNARWTYKFSSQKSIRFNYYGNTNQPSINQIQPVRANEDPLNETIGNPDLNPAFRHSFGGGYNSYKVLSGQYIGLSVNGSFTSNAIISNVYTDTVGKSTYKYENLKDSRPVNYSGYLYYGSKIKSLDLQYGGNLNVNNNSYFNIINDELNKTNSNSFGASLDISKYVQKKYSFRLDAGPSYSSSTSSLQKERSNEGWGFNSSASFNIFLPAKFEVFSDANYIYTGATQTFSDDFQRLIWNGGFRKKFLKKEELILSVTANDILNQNVGFNRNASSGRNTQSSYTTIKRYFMFSLVWEFSQMGVKPQ